jgi:hypothetical protein
MDLQQQLKELCLERGQVTNKAAARLLLYTEYSYRSSSVRKRRAYKALVNYLCHHFHPLTQTIVEQKKMLKALKMLPNKLVTEKDTFHFTPPKDVVFIAKYKTLKKVKGETRIETYYEKQSQPFEIDYESDESSVHSDCVENADHDYSPMKHFDPDELAEYINKTPFFKKSDWFHHGLIHLPESARRVKIGSRVIVSKIHFPSKIYRYLRQIRYVADGDEASLAEKLEKKFRRWACPHPPKKRVMKTKTVYKNVDVKRIREIKTRTEYTEHVYEPVYMNVVKFEGNWVEEMVKLTYKPGFSVIRNELMPYRNINQKMSLFTYTNKRNRKKNVKKATKNREEAIESLSGWDDEKIDKIIRENTLLLLQRPEILRRPEQVFKLAGKVGISWRASKLIHCALKGMIRNTDPYVFLQKCFHAFKLKKAFDSFHFHSRGGDY